VNVHTETAPRSWKRYLRFSVRTMITLVLVIGAALGWVVHHAHVQSDAVASIRTAGGAVWYNWPFNADYRGGKSTNTFLPRHYVPA
jgi:hypothetical protein